MFGPLLAGATLAAFGSAACFGLNGLSFLVVIVALLSMTIKHLPPAERKPMMRGAEGRLRYAEASRRSSRSPSSRSLTTFLGLPLLTFLPVFARDIFQGDVNTFSQMMAFSGAGAVAARSSSRGWGASRTWGGRC